MVSSSYDGVCREVSSSRMVRGAHFPPIIVWNGSAILGSFNFSKANCILTLFGLIIFFSDGDGSSSSPSLDHLITYVCAWKAPRLYNINTRRESLFQQYVIDLIVMVAIRRVPRPSLGCFVRTICIDQT